jgi:hypothetical protein
MRIWFNQFAKHLVAEALRDAAEVRTEHEVSSEVQKVDVWVVPNVSASRTARERAGLLGRMVERPSLIEAFHRPPSPMVVRECLRKQLALEASRRREARRAGGAAPGIPRL